MSINISYLAGAGAQFFDNNGTPLAGGLLYTYLAGTTTPATTYTSRSGAANNTNPIVLDSAGRTPAEIWLNGGVLYKFVLKTSVFVEIGSYDNIPAVNDPTTANNLITIAGTNALTGLSTPTLGGYTAGAQFTFVAQNTNTAAVTIDIDSLGAKSITKYGTTALAAGDLVAGSIALIEYDGTRFQLINPVLSSKLTTSIKTANFAAASINTYAVNTTSGAITATLPALPVAGDYITFTDYARTFTTNNLTINPNGGKINASTSNVILNVSGAAVSLVYIDATQGWLAYSGFISNPTTNYSANYLVVAGGGGGAGSASSNTGGGGGAGGLLTGATTLISGVAYTITIGSGGAGGTNSPTSGFNGTNSSISILGITSIGGGGGAPFTGGVAGSGGSGGGTGANSGAGSGTSGQGFAGGTSGGQTNSTGGGGGASAVGVTPGVANTGGAGGAGASNSISGAALNYAGGGGGGSFGTGGAGGVGGGGTGGTASPSVASTAGTANTGGGGGGSGNATSGSNGGSGIVVIAYLGSQRGTGGTVTSVSGYTIHTFTSSSTYNA